MGHKPYSVRNEDEGSVEGPPNGVALARERVSAEVMCAEMRNDHPERAYNLLCIMHHV